MFLIALEYRPSLICSKHYSHATSFFGLIFIHYFKEETFDTDEKPSASIYKLQNIKITRYHHMYITYAFCVSYFCLSPRSKHYPEYF